MADSCINSYGYKLRAGTPQVLCSQSSQDCECRAGNRNIMILQCFGADLIQGRVYQATDTLPESGEFIGMNPEGTLENASFQASQYTTLEGVLIWTGTEQLLTEHTTEDQIPGFELDNAGLLFGV